MSESVAIDFNELGRLIAAELDSGVQTVTTSVPWSGQFHIVSMRVRLGQAQHDLTSETEGDLPSIKKKMLLQDRYPLSEQGWMFELELATGAAPTKFKFQGRPPVTLPGQLQTSAMEIFGDLPINAIKVVAGSWADIFIKADIKTIIDLVKIKHEILIELVLRHKKNHPIDLHTKARLLNIVVPVIPASSLDQFSLYSFLTDSPAALRNKIGVQRFSASASEQLSELIALLYTVLDSRVLKSYTLKNLRSFSLNK